jgi:hypothetical protein
MDGQPLIERPDELAGVSDILRRMADIVDRNKGAVFGGLAVVIPPGANMATVETLILDSQGDAAQFFSTLQTRLTILLAELQASSRMNQGFGGRR